ncbi:MAG: CDP-diacylglycerol--serine O-phosphatidyltransferase [Prevotella sp.]|nr:CDP-diacylglycerol--serine O-phosphatidyltransferase [Prevotella sp.]
MKRHIPNIITSCNLISGCIAVFNAFLVCYEAAFFFIVLGAVFDFFDGMSARLLGVSSPIGKELDSLADCITFGLAPSAMIFTFLSSQDYPSAVAFAAPYIPYVAFIMAAFSALRLAKFNLDERQTTSFIGLPTPANALFWASLIVGSGSFLSSSPAVLLAVVAMVLVCSWVLVAEIPMFALKFKTWGWRGNEVKYIFLITCIPLLLVFRISGFAAVIAWYVILSVLTARRQPAA